MRDAANIRAVEALGISLMGLIFWPKSKRYVSERPAYLPTQCKRVGVFVDEDSERVRHIADEYALDIIQLHGSESPEYAKALRQWPLIKAFNIATKEDLRPPSPTRGLLTISSSTLKAKASVVMARSSTGACLKPILVIRPSCSVVASVLMMLNASKTSIIPDVWV